MLTAAEKLVDLSFLAQDPEGSGRGYWFIALMVILAIQHFSEKLKEKREAKIEAKRGADRSSDSDDADSPEAWDEGYRDPAPSSETLTEFFRSLTKGQTEPVAPPPPPPTPQARTPSRSTPLKLPPAPARAKQAAAVALTSDERRALAALKSGVKSNLTHGRTHRQRMRSSSQHSALGKMLRDPVSLRNAFILKEILDPPVASREDPTPHQI